MTTLWLTAGLFHQVVDERPEALRRPAPAPGRRRRALAAARAAARSTVCPGVTPDQRLRPDREHDLHLLPPDARRGAAEAPGADRPADRQHAASTCSTATCGRCRSGVPGELLVGGDGAGPRLPAAARTSPPSASCPIPSAASRARGSTAPATSPAGGRTARSSSSAGVDHQVKVRGFRIELGEIEARARATPGGARGGGGGARGRAGRAGAWSPTWCRGRGRRRAPAAGDGAEQVAPVARACTTTTYDQGARPSGDADLQHPWAGTAATPASRSPPRRCASGSSDTVGAHPRAAPAAGAGDRLRHRAAAVPRGARTASATAATDFSGVALAQAPAPSSAGAACRRSSCAQGAADDLTGVRAGRASTPSSSTRSCSTSPTPDYLVKVLEGAVAAVAAGRRGLRGRRAQPAAARGLPRLGRAAPGRRAAAGARAAHGGCGAGSQDEEELVVDPALLPARWRRGCRGSGRVEIAAQARARTHNELTRFRYDVVLHVGDGGADGGPGTSADARLGRRSDVERPASGSLEAAAARPLAVSRHAQRAPGRARCAALELLGWRRGRTDRGELRARCSSAERRGGDRPRGRSGPWPTALGYDVELSWSAAGGADGALRRRSCGRRGAASRRGFRRAGAADRGAPWRALRQRPAARGAARAGWRRELRALSWAGAAGVHGAVAPSCCSTRCRSPPTARWTAGALPAPETRGRSATGTCVAPRTPIEERLAGDLGRGAAASSGWACDDNFFDLGGHSLLATQLVSRLRRRTALGAAADGVRGRRRWRSWPTACRGQAAEPRWALDAPGRPAGPARRRAACSSGCGGSGMSSPTASPPSPGAAGPVREAAGEAAAGRARPHQPPPIRRVSGPPARGTGRCRSTRSASGSWSSSSPGGRGSTSSPPPACAGRSPCRPWRRALAEIVRRHARLAHHLPGGRAAGPCSGWPPRGAGGSPVSTSRRLPAARREAEALRLVARTRPRPFDLERGPLLRATPAAPRRAASTSACSTMHHIVTDGSSFQIVWARAGGALRGARGRPAVAAAGAAGPVRRTSPSGSAAGCRARCWSAGRLVARAAGGRPAGARAADRPAAAGGGADARRAAARRRPRRELAEALRALARRGGRDALHDPARRLRRRCSTALRARSD